MKNMLTAIFLVLSLATVQAQTFDGGTGRSTTKVFETSGPWTLNWNFQGQALKVFIHHADTTKAVGEPIRQAGTGSGSVTMEKAGRFYLHIKSVGDYNLSVKKLASNTSSLPSYSGNTERKGSPIFEVPKGWGYRAKSQGTVLKVSLFDADRKQVGKPVALVGGGEVRRFVDQPGKYFFMFQAVGPYQVEVFKK